MNKDTERKIRELFKETSTNSVIEIPFIYVEQLLMLIPAIQSILQSEKESDTENRQKLFDYFKKEQ